MLYYRYSVLWETFFKELHCDVITSEETNRRILEEGIQYSIDECCLPSKIYMGHVASLIGKCDYILAPRVVNYGKREDVCVKFNALYDIVRCAFEGVKLLDYNIDLQEGQGEQKGFLCMAKELGKGKREALAAYRRAKDTQERAERREIETQNSLLSEKNGFKILIVSHPYNTYDRFIGYPVVEYLKKLGATPVFADRTDRDLCSVQSKRISESLYWTYNKELVGSINLLQDKVDGIILVTAFPCGPDSLVNELIIRRCNDKPVIHIILDELQAEAGLQTRIESFLDIIREKAGEQVYA